MYVCLLCKTLVLWKIYYIMENTLEKTFVNYSKFFKHHPITSEENNLLKARKFSINSHSFCYIQYRCETHYLNGSYSILLELVSSIVSLCWCLLDKTRRIIFMSWVLYTCWVIFSGISQIYINNSALLIFVYM